MDEEKRDKQTKQQILFFLLIRLIFFSDISKTQKFQQQKKIQKISIGPLAIISLIVC